MKRILIRIAAAAMYPLAVLKYRYRLFVAYTTGDKGGSSLPRRLAYQILRLAGVVRNKLASIFNETYVNHCLRDNATNQKKRELLMHRGFGGGKLLQEGGMEEYSQRLEQRRIGGFLDAAALVGIDQDSSVLDVGCGAGADVQYLKSTITGIRVDAIDVRQEAVDHVNKTYGDDKTNAVCGNILEEDFLDSIPDNTYDWIHISSVLSHLMGTSIEDTVRIRKRILGTLLEKANKGLLILDVRIPEKPYLLVGLINNYIEDYAAYFADSQATTYILPHILPSSIKWGYIIKKR